MSVSAAIGAAIAASRQDRKAGGRCSPGEKNFSTTEEAVSEGLAIALRWIHNGNYDGRLQRPSIRIATVTPPGRKWLPSITVFWPSDDGLLESIVVAVTETFLSMNEALNEGLLNRSEVGR